MYPINLVVNFILNIMKKIQTLALCIILGGMQLCVAQGKITDFKSIIQDVENGGVKVIIKPLSFDPNQKDYKSFRYNYGVRICYTLNGEKKAARQDMSYDIYHKGEYHFQLAYGSKYNTTNVRITDIQYFNIDDIPESQWPEKEDCF